MTKILLNRVFLVAFFLASIVAGSVNNDVETALKKLYDHCNGSNWNHDSNWKSGDPCENSWYGITCNSADTKVTEIDLSNNNLKCDFYNEMQQYLGDLTDVEILDLSHNSLSDIIPPALDQMTSLQQLLLSHNKFEQTIPLFTDLVDLLTLDVSYNDLAGNFPSYLSNLPNLQDLDLSKNDFLGYLPANLDDFEHLTSFNVSYNDFTGAIPDAFSFMPDLTLVDLSHNDLSGIVPPVPPEIKYIDITHNNGFECPYPDMTFAGAVFRDNCDYCPPGYGYSSSAEGCSLCSPGEYSDGSHSCKSCSSNYFSPDFGAPECEKCPSGYSAPSGSALCYASQEAHSSGSTKKSSSSSGGSSNGHVHVSVGGFDHGTAILVIEIISMVVLLLFVALTIFGLLKINGTLERRMYGSPGQAGLLSDPQL